MSKYVIALGVLFGLWSPAHAASALPIFRYKVIHPDGEEKTYRAENSVQEVKLGKDSPVCMIEINGVMQEHPRRLIGARIACTDVIKTNPNPSLFSTPIVCREHGDSGISVMFVRDGSGAAYRIALTCPE